MSESKDILISWLVLDAGTQSRAELDKDTIADYAEAYERGDAMPPVDVFYDGRAHILANGFHRVHGAKKATKKRINCTVHQGKDRDAILFSVGANATHGLRRSNADKRRAVECLLRDKEWAKQSDRWIAERCAVGHQLVGHLRAQLDESSSSKPSQPAARKGKDGKTRKVKLRVVRGDDDNSAAAADGTEAEADSGVDHTEPADSRADEFVGFVEAAKLDRMIAAFVEAWPKKESLEDVISSLEMALNLVRKMQKKREVA